jgi:Glutathione S-transferase, N-terminal domain
MYTILILTYFSLIALTPCSGFSMNPLTDMIQKMSSNAGGKTQKDPSQLLKELNIEASTSPRLAYARAERIPSLLVSSAAPLLRRASGVFPCNYNVQLVDRNETIYSYVAFDTINKQLSETGYSNLPALPLELYENESDADSKLVREACSMLSLIVTMYPMPDKGQRYRSKVNPNDYINTKIVSKPNDSNFPYFYDPNTKVRLAGSRRIIDYIFTKYGPPSTKRLDQNDNIPQGLQQPATGVNWPRLTASIGVSLISNNAGGRCMDSTIPTNMQPIVLYAYEGSPFCKVVREALSSYEIPHTIYYTPRGSVNRQRLYDLTKLFQVPYLQDPNTGVDLFESEAIVEYIRKQYGLIESPVKVI